MRSRRPYSLLSLARCLSVQPGVHEWRRGWLLRSYYPACGGDCARVIGRSKSDPVSSGSRPANQASPKPVEDDGWEVVPEKGRVRAAGLVVTDGARQVWRQRNAHVAGDGGDVCGYGSSGMMVTLGWRFCLLDLSWVGFFCLMNSSGCLCRRVTGIGAPRSL